MDGWKDGGWIGGMSEGSVIVLLCEVSMFSIDKTRAENIPLCVCLCVSVLEEWRNSIQLNVC